MSSELELDISEEKRLKVSLSIINPKSFSNVANVLDKFLEYKELT